MKLPIICEILVLVLKDFVHQYYAKPWEMKVGLFLGIEIL